MQKKWTKYLIITLTTMLIGSLFTGCGGGSAEKTQTSAKDTLTVAVAYDAATLDPVATNDVASSNSMAQIYEQLVQMNDKNEIVPMLAESFKQVDDVTYEFKLKKGVKFHNGEEMKASDVKFSLIRAGKAPAVASIVGDMDTNSFQTPDDYTVSFKVKHPSTGFLAGLVLPAASILSEKAVTAAGDKYGMNPVGTGPFKFVSWTKGNQLTLQRFDGYHGDKPKFSKMVINVIPEPTNRTIALETGEADIAYEITANDLKRVQDNKDLQLLRTIDFSTTYLGFNCAKKPFDDVKVRQAISYAIDTKQIVSTVWKGIGKAAVGPIPAQVKYSDTSLTVHEYNVEKAKELLKEAGYPSGFKASIWVNQKKERIDMATIIQSELKDIGIDVQIKVLEWGAYLAGASKGEHDMFMIGWVSQTTDPDIAVNGPFLSTNKGAGSNYSFFNDPLADQLILKGKTMKDSDERKDVYYQLQKEIIAQAPWVLLYNGEQVVGANKSVKGFKPSPLGFHKLYNVSFQ
jgi:peptide/nickel transport system substrate-binding protein